ncbi:hypothetical protein AOZ07_16670 [Glutamicibacter halophytocola]|nr:hypothetical protein AOZ07_16670 [Glutamicibacter halophytocola]
MSAAALRELQDAFGAASAELARRMAMNSTDALAIEYIALSATALSPGELGERLAITRSSTTEVIDRLVAAGHVERIRDERDRRRFRLIPTAQAKNRVRAEISPLVGALNEASAGFSSSERLAISTYLDRVIDAYRGFASEAPQADG